ncbi:cytochrome P450 [Alteromonas lipotrueiana]|uniref:cytochrome P450 n=1 Tax=Alteromonas lipotrueiana TaxID=2803815 RepID=UPI001C44A7A5|nr:cytochrome P450 [Alteromonas lipotrueiana]
MESFFTKYLDHTLALYRDPYRYISKLCNKHDSDVVETRILMQKFICVRGEEAARLFYDNDKFNRQNVAPGRIKKTLFGEGGVQGLDDAAHKHRKAMFMQILVPEKIETLSAISRRRWKQLSSEGDGANNVCLYSQTRKLLTQSVCEWAGVPLAPDEAGQRAAELASLYEDAGSIGLSHWKARRARKLNEKWLMGVIETIRANPETNSDTPAAVIALHQNPDGQLLDVNIAAIELNNILRPTVAVSIYVLQCAHALKSYPKLQSELQHAAPEALDNFVQEVRRFYPFFPFTVARVKRTFTWRNQTFPVGRKVLLDLYGTNHDARIWDSPDLFSPQRFANAQDNTYRLIPQGGGEHYRNHRCPGEWVTIEQMKIATEALLNCEYEVTGQNLDMDMKTLPARPSNKFLLKQVRAR